MAWMAHHAGEFNIDGKAEEDQHVLHDYHCQDQGAVWPFPASLLHDCDLQAYKQHIARGSSYSLFANGVHYATSDCRMNVGRVTAEAGDRATMSMAARLTTLPTCCRSIVAKKGM